MKVWRSGRSWARLAPTRGNRRAAALVGLALAFGTSALAQWPEGLPLVPTPIPSKPYVSGGTSRSVGSLRGGCWLAASSGGVPGRTSPSSGNQTLDRALLSEGQWVTRSFGVSVFAVFLDDEDAPNAFASPAVTSSAYPDGTIALGKTLLNSELGRDVGMGFAVIAIMSHECAHIMQNKNRIRLPGRYQELQADFMAGWYLGARSRFMYTDVRPAFEAFFAIGDYDFNSPGHHGTPAERLGAIQAGYRNSGLSALAALSMSTNLFRQMAMTEGSVSPGE